MTAKLSKFPKNYAAGAGDFDSNVPNLQVFSLADIETATDGLSVENKLGEGGYGPVYKVNFDPKKKKIKNLI